MDNLNLDDDRIGRDWYGEQEDSILAEQEACRKSMLPARPRGWKGGSKGAAPVKHTISPASITLDRRASNPGDSPLNAREQRKLLTERRLVAKPGSFSAEREPGDSWYCGSD